MSQDIKASFKKKHTHTHTQHVFYHNKKSNMVSQTINQKDILSMIMIIYEALHNEWNQDAKIKSVPE